LQQPPASKKFRAAAPLAAVAAVDEDNDCSTAATPLAVVVVAGEDTVAYVAKLDTPGSSAYHR
jgi:hypothetical protein